MDKAEGGGSPKLGRSHGFT